VQRAYVRLNIDYTRRDPAAFYRRSCSYPVSDGMNF